MRLTKMLARAGFRFLDDSQRSRSRLVARENRKKEAGASRHRPLL